MLAVASGGVEPRAFLRLIFDASATCPERTGMKWLLRLDSEPLTPSAARRRASRETA
jgi:hypothetical protein